MRLVALIVTAFALAGCGDRAAVPWAPLDGFERDPLWAHDSEMIMPNCRAR